MLQLPSDGAADRMPAAMAVSRAAPLELTREGVETKSGIAASLAKA